jgi:hypothetical protein
LEHKEKEIADMSKRQTFITPKGVAKYPWLTVPSTQFNPDGDYKVDLVLDPSDPAVEAFLSSLDEDVKTYFSELAKKDKKKANLAKTAKVPYTSESDPATGDDTGMVVVKFKTGYKPGLFDSKRQPITGDVKVGSGSIIKVAFQKNYYEGFGGGMNLYLQQVQIINLVEYNAKGEPAAGFEEEEGFEADQPPPKESFPTDAPGEGEEGEEQDNLPFDNPPPAASGGDDDPRDELIEKALVDDKKLGLADRSHKAKIGYPQLRELWDAKKGNPAMFRIALNTMLKQKGV